MIPMLQMWKLRPREIKVTCLRPPGSKMAGPREAVSKVSPLKCHASLPRKPVYFSMHTNKPSLT